MKEGQVKLTNVRLSFPQLFEAKQVNGEGKPRFSAAFLMDPSTTDGKRNIKAIQAEMKRVAEEKWGAGKVPKSVKYALQDGDTKEYDGYEGMRYLSTGNSADRAPTVGKWNKDAGVVMEARPDEIYAGCYVHAIVGFWAQDNQYGKRINANLHAVIFYKDGQPFGSGAVKVDDAFDESDFDFVDEDEEEDFLG